MAPCKSICFSAFLAFVHVSAHAADPAYSADLLAQGQAGIAASENNLALLTNPGLVALDERYDFGVSGQIGPVGATQIGVSVVDAKTSKFLSLGFFYVGDKSESPPTVDLLPGWVVPGEAVANVRREHNMALTVGTDAFDRRLSFGITGALSIYNHDLQGKGTTGNLDAGIGFDATHWLVLATTARNLLPIDNAGGMPLNTGVGAKVHGRKSSLLADGSWTPEDENPWSAGGGVQQNLGDYTKARLGFRYDGPQQRQDITAGLGLGNDAGGFDFGVAIPVDGREDVVKEMVWGVSLTFAAPDLGDPPG